MPSYNHSKNVYNQMSDWGAPYTAYTGTQSKDRITDPASSFRASSSYKVQFNVCAFMYYKGKRISKIVDTFVKDWHPKVKQELIALNLDNHTFNQYVYVSLVEKKQDE